LSVGFDVAPSSLPPTDWDVRLAENIAAMASATRAAGARIALLTYPAEQDVYTLANQVLRAAAGDAGIPVIDLGPRFLLACPTGCDEFYRDWHPTAKGHAHVARLILPELRRILDRAEPGTNAAGPPGT